MREGERRNEGRASLRRKPNENLRGSGEERQERWRRRQLKRAGAGKEIQDLIVFMPLQPCKMHPVKVM
jgi:hypothetical protein